MELLQGVCEQFFLDINKIDQEELLLSITHKQILNENKNRHLFIKADYFYEIGRRVYSLLLKAYIHSNFQDNTYLLTNLLHSSNGLFLNEFSDKYNVKKIVICKEELMNEKVLHRLLFQFIGYLYLNSSYKNLERIFSEVFMKEKFELISDYYGFIQRYLKNGQNIICIQLNEVGESNNKTFTYQLQYENKTVIADGPSKRKAIANCAKKYVQDYINKEDIVAYLSSLGVSKNKKKKYFNFTEHKYNLYSNAAKDLKMPLNQFIKCVTHKSISNEYYLENNMFLRTLGSEIEEINLLKWIFRDDKFKNHFTKVLARVLTHKNLYEKLLMKLNLNNLVLTVDGVINDSDAINKAYEDAYKALLYMGLYYNDGEYIFNKVSMIYKDILGKININFIDPNGMVMDFYQTLNLDFNEEILEISLSDFECLITLKFGDFLLKCKSNGESIAASRFNTNKKLLKWLYININNLLNGECVNFSNSTRVEKIFFFLLSSRKQELHIYFKKNNYFFLNFTSENLTVFQDKLIKFTENCFEYFNNETREAIFKFLKSITQNKPYDFYNENILFEAIFDDIYSLDILEIKNYSIEKRTSDLIKNTEKILEKKLEEDWLLIKYLTNPSERLQLAALKSSINSIYFINNPSKKVIEYALNFEDKAIKSFLDKQQSNNEEYNQLKAEKFYDYLTFGDDPCKSEILPDDITFDIHFRTIFNKFDVINLYIATGYMYKSGLELIENEIINIISNKNECKLLIGSLRDYYHNDLITDMDKKTAEYLNVLLKDGCQIKSYENSFYHGKLYIFECRDVLIVIIGSTNVSKSAFRSNKELNTIFFFKTNHENKYIEWFNNLWDESTEIEYLDLSRFGDSITQTFDGDQFQVVSRESLYAQISLLKDVQLKERLLLWLKYNPNNFYENIVISKQNYIAFEYLEKNMVVLDSLYHGNSFFVFYDTSFNLLKDQLKNKTKREIFDLSKMEKRGYHIRNQLSLELNIKSYFL